MRDELVMLFPTLRSILGLRISYVSTFIVIGLTVNNLWPQSPSTPPVRPLLQTGPGGTISYLEAFPDGEHLFSVDRDDTVGIWQIDGGWEVQHLPVGNAPALSGAISPDGQTVVSGGQDGRVLRWSVSGARLLSAQFHPDIGDSSLLVSRIVFSPDGKYFASSGQGHFIKIWDASNGDLVRRIPVTTLHCSVAFVPNSSMLLLDIGSGMISVQGIVDGKEALARKVASGEISDLKIIGDNRLVVASKDGQLSLWQLSVESPYLSSNSLLWSKTGVSAEHVSYDPSTLLLVVWSTNSQICLVDVDSGSRVRTIEVSASAVCTSDLTPSSAHFGV